MSKLPRQIHSKDNKDITPGSLVVLKIEEKKSMRMTRIK